MLITPNFIASVSTSSLNARLIYPTAYLPSLFRCSNDISNYMFKTKLLISAHLFQYSSIIPVVQTQKFWNHSLTPAPIHGPSNSLQNIQNLIGPKHSQSQSANSALTLLQKASNMKLRPSSLIFSLFKRQSDSFKMSNQLISTSLKVKSKFFTRLMKSMSFTYILSSTVSSSCSPFYFSPHWSLPSDNLTG